MDRRPDVDLADIADIDNPIGYHDNYLIVRLREPNALTQYMMSEYYCDVLEICDPDPFGNATPEELREIASCIENQEEVNFEHREIIEKLRNMADGQTQAGEQPEVIVVPSEHVYIEALPGSHPILEDFKLKHRAVDVEKAKAETRQLEIENLRYTQRIAFGELGDPNVEKELHISSTKERCMFLIKNNESSHYKLLSEAAV